MHTFYRLPIMSHNHFGGVLGGDYLYSIVRAGFKKFMQLVSHPVYRTLWSSMHGQHSSMTVPSCSQKLSAHSLANIVWAYAKLESRPQKRFLTAMAGACRVQLHTFESQGITNMLWGFAVMGHADQSLLAAVEVSVIPRLPNFEAQHLANMLWSFAKLGAHAACSSALYSVFVSLYCKH